MHHPAAVAVITELLERGETSLVTRTWKGDQYTPAVLPAAPRFLVSLDLDETPEDPTCDVYVVPEYRLRYCTALVRVEGARYRVRLHACFEHFAASVTEEEKPTWGEAQALVGEDFA